MIFNPDTQILHENISDLKKVYQVEESFYQVNDSLQITGWLFTKNEAEATILFLHGNSGNISTTPWVSILNALSELNVNLFAIDYRGFGKSAGKPTLIGLHEDANEGLRYLVSRNDVVKPIIVYGLSLGSIPAINLSGNANVSGLILEGAITSSRDMLKAFKARKWIYRFWNIKMEENLKFDSTEEIKRVSAPVLIIHGKKDKSVPEYMGRRLYESTLTKNKAYYLVEDGGHCDTYKKERIAYLRQLNNFIQKCSKHSIN